jgi:hypothetical protein
MQLGKFIEKKISHKHFIEVYQSIFVIFQLASVLLLLDLSPKVLDLILLIVYQHHQLILLLQNQWQTCEIFSSKDIYDLQ